VNVLEKGYCIPTATTMAASVSTHWLNQFNGLGIPLKDTGGAVFQSAGPTSALWIKINQGDTTFALDSLPHLPFTQEKIDALCNFLKTLIGYHGESFFTLQSRTVNDEVTIRLTIQRTHSLDTNTADAAIEFFFTCVAQQGGADEIINEVLTFNEDAADADATMNKLANMVETGLKGTRSFLNDDTISDIYRALASSLASSAVTSQTKEHFLHSGNPILPHPAYRAQDELDVLRYFSLDMVELQYLWRKAVDAKAKKGGLPKHLDSRLQELEARMTDPLRIVCNPVTTGFFIACHFPFADEDEEYDGDVLRRMFQLHTYDSAVHRKLVLAFYASDTLQLATEAGVKSVPQVTRKKQMDQNATRLVNMIQLSIVYNGLSVVERFDSSSHSSDHSHPAMMSKALAPGEPLALEFGPEEHGYFAPEEHGYFAESSDSQEDDTSPMHLPSESYLLHTTDKRGKGEERAPSAEGREGAEHNYRIIHDKRVQAGTSNPKDGPSSRNQKPDGEVSTSPQDRSTKPGHAGNKPSMRTRTSPSPKPSAKKRPDTRGNPITQTPSRNTIPISPQDRSTKPGHAGNKPSTGSNLDTGRSEEGGTLTRTHTSPPKGNARPQRATRGKKPSWQRGFET
jgi:hypothetical protein